MPRHWGVMTELNAMNHYLTQREAAEALRLSPRTLERHRLTGTGPKFKKFGRRVVYSHADIEAWASANTFASTSEVKEAL